MLSRKDFKKEATAIINWIDEYYQQLPSLPVKSQVLPKQIYEQIPEKAPQEGEAMATIVNDLNTIILPGITHWQHPNFHAYFPGNSSVESVLAEMVTAAIGAQCMIWDTSPAAAELEERMLEWLRDVMALPNSWEGVIQDTASSASLVALLTAREVATNFQSNKKGVPNNLRIYCSKETHSSIEKGVAISGIGTRNLVKIDVDEQLRMRPDQLAEQIEQDIAAGLTPCCVVAAIGTTGTVAIDPLRPIAELCQRHNIWLHVDAAYAGSALLLPEYHWMIDGIELADSFVFNPHKWLFTNFDCSAYYVKDVNVLLKTFEVLPEYLKTKTRGQVNDYRDWGIPLGRRFRALKLWFLMRSYGIRCLQKKLRKHIELNNYFAEQIQTHPELELSMPPVLNFSCFQLKEKSEESLEKNNARSEQLLHRLNESGTLFLTHTKIRGRYTLRMVIGNTYVEREHVDRALGAIDNALKAIKK